jgi:hypothetical protein
MRLKFLGRTEAFELTSCLLVLSESVAAFDATEKTELTIHLTPLADTFQTLAVSLRFGFSGCILG